MKLIVLGRDVPLTRSDLKNNGEEELRTEESLNNEYIRSCEIDRLLDEVIKKQKTKTQFKWASYMIDIYLKADALV